MTRSITKRRVTDELANAAGKKKATKKSKKEKALKNYVAIIVDKSASMFGHEESVVLTVNEQFENMRVASQSEGQETYVTLRTFSSNVSAPVINQEDISVLRDWTHEDYVTGGMTALYDAIGYTIRDFERVRDANKDNVSFLLIVATDGHENCSLEFKGSIQQVIADKQKTDRWTFVCLVPPGHRDITSRQLGIPAGNIREWEQSVEGFDQVRTDVRAGLGNYYATRSTGATATTSFFVNTGHIDEDDLGQLDDVSGDYDVWTVNTKNAREGTKDGHIRIDDYVNGRLAGNARLRKKFGDRYELRRGYYQLTKSEKVQPSKDIVIQDLDTGKMYGGYQARSLLGLPQGEYIRVRPGDHSGHRIFVLSTSINRNLVDKTKLLYKKT